MAGKRGFFILIVFLAGFFSFSRAQQEDTSAFYVKRLSINSNRGDFSPYLLQKKLYFSTGRVHRYGLVYFNEDTLKELEDVFYADEIDSVNFKYPHYFSEKVNTKFNDGPLCFNKTGDVLYITGNDLKRITKHVEPLDIFVSHKVNGHWEVPVSLPFCTGTNSYCHPALMNDGKTLIFSSDLPGGYGGMDLYSSVFENGAWSPPKNLGAKINSKSNELFPFVNATDVMYFSSNRNGNLDIYSIDLKNPVNSEIKKEGWPFNSDKDDFGVWVDSAGNSGYFSSDREGNDDIFYFKNKYPHFDNCIAQKKPSYCYTFFEESSMQSEDTLGMIYEWDLGDGTKTRGLTIKHCYSKPGAYSVQLNIVDKVSGALFYNELSYDFTVEEAKLLYIESADTLLFGKAASLNSKKSVIPGYRIAERYWFFGDGKFSQGESVQHIYEKEGEYWVQLGVIVKNDSTGKTEKFCTQKKVLVKDSLWIKNHQSSLTKVVWPPPRNVDSTYHVKEGGDVNFRVHLGSSRENIPIDAKVFSDLKDVKKTKEKDVYHYTTGQVKKLTDAIPYYRKAREKGFKSAVVISFYKDSLLPKQEKSMKGEVVDTKVVRVTIDSNKVLWSLNVFFDFNKANFAKIYNYKLDSVCKKLRENKKLELIILSVSDTIGTNDYNLKLSKRRATSVQNYLRKKGIDQKRLDVISLGENLPEEYNSGKNVLLSNRRVELIIVKNAK
ncbi:MAG TPA: PKD domain-containing protein [Bacteroidia bacterium]|jgi:outer membrane protein OmpA-like peptidoglycan-associated protein|nr:PKD domain-containing protein [Bacteroidia bacterium]